MESKCSRQPIDMVEWIQAAHDQMADMYDGKALAR